MALTLAEANKRREALVLEMHRIPAVIGTMLKRVIEKWLRL